MKKKILYHSISFIALIVFCFLAFGSIDTDSDTKKVKSQKPSYTLSAYGLYRNYEDNEVAADAKFKGKVIVIFGPIVNIGKDIMDQAYIVVGGEGFLDGVQCTFSEGGKSIVSRLSKGQQVKVKGVVAGKMGNVLMNKCTIQ